MNAPMLTHRETLTRLALPLATVFVVALGYGVVLPVLPFILARALGETAIAAIARHTGLLTGIYMLALFAAAPLWGRACDRIGWRTTILIGLAGFGGATLAFVLLPGLVFAYGTRALAGVFAAAAVPAVFAWAGDREAQDVRARAFAWLYAANALGFLAGPALSAGLVNGDSRSAAGPVAGSGLALPFYAVVLLTLGVWLAAYRWRPEREIRDGPKRAPPRDAPSLAALLVLSLLVLFGLGSYEVALALLGRQSLGLGPRAIGIMFVECSLVMILVQAFVLAPLIKRTAGALLAPALLAMAAGLALLPFAAGYGGLLLVVALVAGASGLLIPALAYLVSLAAGAGQGSAFGIQTAVTSLGQGAGSAAAGWLFALSSGAPFWIAAALLGFGVVAARAIAGRAGEAPHGR